VSRLPTQTFGPAAIAFARNQDPINLTAVGEGVSLEVAGLTTLRGRCDLIGTVTTLGGLVLALKFKLHPQDADWIEIDTSQRLSASPLFHTSPVDVTGIWMARLEVITASSTSGLRGIIALYAEGA
jgi:hypothetical protein